MSLSQRNDYLLSRVVAVYLQSIAGKDPFLEFTRVYGSPKTIKLTIGSQRIKSGHSYRYNLSMLYPGLSEEDFEAFDAMLRDKYRVMVKLSDDNLYELSSKHFPFDLKVTFNQGKGTTLVLTSVSPIPKRITYEYAEADYVLNYSE